MSQDVGIADQQKAYNTGRDDCIKHSVYWTRDWTVGLDSQKVVLIRFRSSTHTTTLQYTYIT